MTKYFEVTKRDVAARIGRLMLDKQYQTPLILHAGAKSPIVYAGTLWARDTMSTDQVESGKLVILPDKPMPLHLEQNKVKKDLTILHCGTTSMGGLGRSARAYHTPCHAGFFTCRPVCSGCIRTV